MKCPAHLLKSTQDFSGAGMAIFRIRRHTAPGNYFERCWERSGGEGSPFRKMSGEHLVKDDAERVDVVAWSCNAIEALRSHKGAGADLVASGSQWRTCRSALF